MCKDTKKHYKNHSSDKKIKFSYYSPQALIGQIKNFFGLI